MSFCFDRRRFVSFATAAATAATLPRWAMALDADNPYRKNIGIQLYTLRDAIGEDADATLQTVAETGYQQVEPYGFPNCEPIISAAKKAGLPIHSSHFNSDPVITRDDAGGDDLKHTIEKAVEVGLKHLVIPYVGTEHRKTLDDYRRMAERCNRAAEMVREAGMQLAYHNHAFEFEPLENGRCGYDVFREDFADAMKFEVDVFWVQAGGVDPVELMSEMKGRISQLHLKDLNRSVKLPAYDGMPKEGFEELGDGVVDIETIVAAAGDAGVDHCHVEQDHSPHPIESIAQSFRYLKNL